MGDELPIRFRLEDVAQVRALIAAQRLERDSILAPRAHIRIFAQLQAVADLQKHVRVRMGSRRVDGQVVLPVFLSIWMFDG
jgi:hypothetical protein